MAYLYCFPHVNRYCLIYISYTALVFSYCFPHVNFYCLINTSCIALIFFFLYCFSHLNLYCLVYIFCTALIFLSCTAFSHVNLYCPVYTSCTALIFLSCTASYTHVLPCKQRNTSLSGKSNTTWIYRSSTRCVSMAVQIQVEMQYRYAVKNSPSY